MISSGLATVGEVAHLRGVSRQAIQKATRNLQPRRRREVYLRNIWKQTIKRTIKRTIKQLRSS
jgi:predicted DNA-binding protein YlxM (UPF0122 family)